MKKSIYLLILIIVISFIGLNSCDKTTNDPTADPRAQYLGTWLCSESPTVNYHVIINLDTSNSSQILMYNFHLLGNTAKAYAIATQNNLTLPAQGILGKIIHGSGDLINNNKFTLKYYVNDSTDIDTINAVYTK
jgi:hypothetical protein